MLVVIDHGDGVSMVVDQSDPNDPVVLVSFIQVNGKWEVKEVFGDGNEW